VIEQLDFFLDLLSVAPHSQDFFLDQLRSLSAPLAAAPHLQDVALELFHPLLVLQHPLLVLHHALLVAGIPSPIQRRA
jgi:hypothetical protein